MEDDYDYYTEPDDFGMEQVENEDFAHDSDRYNMYPTPEGYSTNTDPMELEHWDGHEL